MPALDHRYSAPVISLSLHALRIAGVGLMSLLAGCAGAQETALVSDPVPEWATDAVFYQVFPERFRNGDPSNDPTRASLEYPVDERVPAGWQVSPWTGDWYARPPWEAEQGESFYEHGVFDRRYGGDLQGVIDQLDYLRDLGVNALYFNPVFYARSLHKYDGNTFHHVDPHFGPDPEGDFALMATETADPDTWHWTAADRLFLDLIREAHARGIRVVIDGVFNHTGRDFFAFADLRDRQQDSPYRDWYIVQAFDDPATPENEFRYKGWWDVLTLPEFANTADGLDLHPGPKAYVFDITSRWMDPDGDGDHADGIDGWRLDVANEVPIRFWTDWNAHVRALNPEAYTVTELWEDAGDFLREGGFSATMNYHAFAFPVKGYFVDAAASPSAFAEMLEARRADYPEEVQRANQNLIDSHDTDRLASMIVNAGRQPYENAERFDYDVGSRVSPRNTPLYDVRRPTEAEREVQRLVALFQMTYVGAPMVYYGTEAGMWGADDPDDRMPMVWPDLTYAPQCADPLGRARTCDAIAFDPALHAFYRDVIALRHAHDALRRGAFRVLLADDERNLFGYARTLGDDAFVVVFNRSDEAHGFRVEKPAAGAYELAFITTDGPHRVQEDETGLILEVPARTGLVLRRTGD
jgi:glycosidase